MENYEKYLDPEVYANMIMIGKEINQCTLLELGYYEPSRQAKNDK
jgi:hypothetical protein